ncbi:hypothetical protein [Kerstersia gyiorum]|uniref:hypothetical protein n=1 Tax=Kerstersia gyiorum TaxID=206506 RepID=UPI003B439513
MSVHLLPISIQGTVLSEKSLRWERTSGQSVIIRAVASCQLPVASCQLPGGAAPEWQMFFQESVTSIKDIRIVAFELQ